MEDLNHCISTSCTDVILQRWFGWYRQSWSWWYGYRGALAKQWKMHLKLVSALAGRFVRLALQESLTFQTMQGHLSFRVSYSPLLHVLRGLIFSSGHQSNVVSQSRSTMDLHSYHRNRSRDHELPQIRNLSGAPHHLIMSISMQRTILHVEWLWLRFHIVLTHKFSL